jgi:hypothetical protein
LSVQRDEFKELKQGVNIRKPKDAHRITDLEERVSELQNVLDEILDEWVRIWSTLNSLQKQLEVSKPDFSLRIQSFIPYHTFLKEIK